MNCVLVTESEIAISGKGNVLAIQNMEHEYIFYICEHQMLLNRILIN